LAGVCTFDEAERVGYGVEEAVAYLKRFHWATRRTWHILISRIAAYRESDLDTRADLEKMGTSA
jgi:hypothetical protein